MAWHKCSRYWKHGATCSVRGMPGHESEEEEDDKEDEDGPEIPKVLVPGKKPSRPVEPGSVVAVAEAIVREVQTRQVPEPVAAPAPEPVGQPSRVAVPVRPVPSWVPPVREVVVPDLFPTPADVADPRVGDAFVPGTPFDYSSTPAVAPSINPSIGDKIVEGTIAAGIGVAIGIVTVATGGAAVPWIQRIVTISRILRTLSPQAGYIGMPTARTLLLTAGAAVVRAAAAKIPDQPPDQMREGPLIDQAMGMVEELVVDHVYPTAAERSVTISRYLAGVSSKSEPVASTVTSTNPFGDWNDAFMAPGMYGPPPAESSPSLASEPGGHGYLYDFGQYLNSELGNLENPGGSPTPISY